MGLVFVVKVVKKTARNIVCVGLRLQVSLALSIEVLAVPAEDEEVLLDEAVGSAQKPEAKPEAVEESLV